MVSKTKNPLNVLIEKFAPRNHRLFSLDKPRDAKRWSSGQIFLSHTNTHDGFLYTVY